jgi:uncharacterized protein involved in response to NO
MELEKTRAFSRQLADNPINDGCRTPRAACWARPPAFERDLNLKTSPRVTLQEVAKEPFRVFFPAGVLAAIAGASLWPLYFGGVVQFYPGQVHARVMVYGLFGGFIFGFLGTSLPGLIGAKPFCLLEVVCMVALHLGSVFSLVAGNVLAGDGLFLALLASFSLCAALRAARRKDTPPPGFVLVGMAFLCAAAGTVISIIQSIRELDYFWVALQRLLAYQGFVLLPILGVGPFILPRFFGVASRHDFPKTKLPTKAWRKKALLALAVGSIIAGSFFVEASGGRIGLAHALRFAATLGFLLSETPFQRPREARATAWGSRFKSPSLVFWPDTWPSQSSRGIG